MGHPTQEAVEELIRRLWHRFPTGAIRVVDLCHYFFNRLLGLRLLNQD